MRNILFFFLYAIVLIPAMPVEVFLLFFEPYTFGKTQLFEILVEAMAIVWIVGSRRRLGKHLQALAKQKIARAIFLLFAVFTVSALASADSSASFWGSSARNDGLFTLAHFVLLFAVLASVFEKRELYTILRFSVFASLFAAFYALLQYFQIPWVRASNGDIFGTIGNPAYLAMYLSFHVFLAIFFAKTAPLLGSQASAWKLGFQVVLYAIAGFQSVVVLLTYNRAGIIGLALGALVILYPYAKERFLKMPAWGKAATHSALLWCVFAFLLALPYAVSYAQQDATMQSRALAWRVALETIPERIVIGHGAGRFEKTYTDYIKRAGIVTPTQETFDKPHNIILETAFSWGLLGLAAYLWLWYALAKVIQNTYTHRERFLWYGMFAAYGISLLFLFDTFVSQLMFFALLAFFALPETPPASPHPTWESNSQVGWVAGIACFLALFLVFHFKPLYSAYYARNLFIQAQKTGALDERLKTEALRYPSFNAYFIRNAIRQFEHRK